MLVHGWLKSAREYQRIVIHAMLSAHTTTPGKAILAGEHFVLHGVPAVAVPVFERQLQLDAEWHDDGDGDDSDRLELPDALAPLADAIDQALNHWLRGGRVTLRAKSQIPTGAGLGSSAAWAVAVARVLTTFAEQRRPREVVAFAAADRELMIAVISGTIEQAIHGRASGIDTSTIRLGRPIRLDMAPDGTTIEALHVGRATRFLLVDSGVRRATSQQIARVTSRRHANPAAFAQHTDAAREATLAVIQSLADGDAQTLHRAVADLGRILAGFGLEPPITDAIRRVVEPLGVTIKITGAGGGGFLLGHAEAPDALDRAVEALAASGTAEAFCFNVPATGRA
ncbi:MAG: mevalonate kinase [Planctomycetota bacterium]